MSSPLSSVLRNRLYARARIRHLQVLLQIAELGSVRKAAQLMNLTQPTVTHLLGDLEKLLEVPLFFRHARGMRPTPLVTELLPLVRRILGAIDAAAEQTASLITRSSGVVRLASSGGGITSVLAKALPLFGREYPDVLVQLQEGDPQRLGHLIAAGDVDLVFYQTPDVTPDGWTFHPLADDRFAVIAGPQHPLRIEKTVSIDMLAQETWLALPPDSQANDLFESLYKNNAALPRLRLISGRVPAMLWSMLASEQLVTLVPASVTQQYVEAGLLVELNLDQKLPFKPQGLLRPTAGNGEATNKLALFLEVYCSEHPATPRKLV